MVWKLLRVDSSLYRRLQHTPRLFEEPFEGRIGELFDPRSGVEARLEEDLVRVVITDAGRNLLVHQCRLHRALSPLETLPERGQVQFQKVRARLLLPYERLQMFDKIHLAEHPLAIEARWYRYSNEIRNLSCGGS
jgi:hypothetical protein